MLRNLIWVGLGGAFGSMARYAINLLVTTRGIFTFPIGTFLVNITGCFIIGLLFGVAERYQWMQGSLLIFLATGFCGGFTTFSTFALENVGLFNKQHSFTGILYSLLSVVLGIVLCRAGFLMIKPLGS